MELDDDPKKNDPGVHLRVLRVLLPSLAHVILPDLERAVEEHLEHELYCSPGYDGGQYGPDSR
jgi:hypothetical protein